jgi:hypothetical protein
VHVSGDLATDVNKDGTVNAQDIQFTINAVLGVDIGDLFADIDNSGATNAIDVQMVINETLGL